ncbi:hypothetical protein C8R44DRAFT_880105 [Mycena epipterygia]|nr:hypothetical protein C8R44DRAFT_880105 [Mycena epipterygia]
MRPFGFRNMKASPLHVVARWSSPKLCLAPFWASTPALLVLCAYAHPTPAHHPTLGLAPSSLAIPAPLFPTQLFRLACRVLHHSVGPIWVVRAYRSSAGSSLSHNSIRPRPFIASARLVPPAPFIVSHTLCSSGLALIVRPAAQRPLCLADPSILRVKFFKLVLGIVGKSK